MGASLKVVVDPKFVQWRQSFGQLPVRATAQTRMWQIAGDVMFDKSQQKVHVLSGDLKSSGRPAETKVEGLTVVAEIAYEAEHALFEFSRGGDHDALTRAFEETLKVFEKTLLAMMENAMRRI